MRNEYPDPANLMKAAFFAARKHQNQIRKDVNSTPYINHPLAVAYVLAVETGVKEETILIAALLHDTIEDTDTTPEELDNNFCEEVRRVIEEVTDDKNLEKQKRKELQVQHAPDLSPTAKQLKIADKICNIRDISNTPPVGWSNERKLKYLKWTKDVVDGCRGINKDLEKLYDATLKMGLEKLKESLTMMPHEDKSRVYWKEKSGLISEEEAKIQQDQFQSNMNLKKSSSPADKAFYEVFIEPGLGPKSIENDPVRYRPLYSFIDRYGDEIRISLDPPADEEFCVSKVERFTEGNDGIWYPVYKSLCQPIENDRFLLECAKVFFEETQKPIDQPKKNIAWVKDENSLAGWFRLSAMHFRKGIQCKFEAVSVYPKEFYSKEIVKSILNPNWYPNSFYIDAENLTQLIEAGELLVSEIKNFIKERKLNNKIDPSITFKIEKIRS